MEIRKAYKAGIGFHHVLSIRKLEQGYGFHSSSQIACWNRLLLHSQVPRAFRESSTLGIVLIQLAVISTARQPLPKPPFQPFFSLAFRNANDQIMASKRCSTDIMQETRGQNEAQHAPGLFSERLYLMLHYLSMSVCRDVNACGCRSIIYVVVRFLLQSSQERPRHSQKASMAFGATFPHHLQKASNGREPAKASQRPQDDNALRRLKPKTFPSCGTPMLLPWSRPPRTRIRWQSQRPSCEKCCTPEAERKAHPPRSMCETMPQCTS